MNKVMGKFKRDLLAWVKHIEKMTGTSVAARGAGDSFTLVATWNGGQVEQPYTPSLVMGKFATAPPLQQRPRARICRFRDDFIRKVLHARRTQAAPPGAQQP